METHCEPYTQYVKLLMITVYVVYRFQHVYVQEHLTPLGSISKQAQSMISSAEPVAASLLKHVLDDFRCVEPHCWIAMSCVAKRSVMSL